MDLQNHLDPLRVDIESIIPQNNPYSYLGTAESWDYNELQRAFALAEVIELGNREGMQKQAPPNMAFAGFTSTAPSILPLAMSSHSGMAPAAFSEVWTLKLTKVGLLNRKGMSIL